MILTFSIASGHHQLLAAESRKIKGWNLWYNLNEDLTNEPWIKAKT
jgi:hypothetical protein